MNWLRNFEVESSMSTVSVESGASQDGQYWDARKTPVIRFSDEFSLPVPMQAKPQETSVNTDLDKILVKQAFLASVQRRRADAESWSSRQLEIKAQDRQKNMTRLNSCTKPAPVVCLPGASTHN